MENVRIAVLDTNDTVKTFLDNQAPNALHYFDDELHEYLQGAAATYKLTALCNCEDAQYLIEGNKLAFSYNGKDYYFNIVRVEKDEIEIMIEAYSLSFELLNEYVDKYDPGKAIPFSEYLNAFDPEHVLTIGKNEVTQMKIWHKFEDNQTILGRLFAVADAFNAELEFVTELNSNHSLKRIIVNVYREHSDRFQGMGNDRTDITLRYGKNVTGITKKSSIEKLYTAIRPVGNDGIDIVNVQGKVLDDNEEVEFYTDKGSPDVRAPQARDRFPSNLFTEDRYIVQYKSFEESDPQSLYLSAVNELRKACVPEVEYNVDGDFDTAIGDTVSIEDREFNPVLYLQARVTEQIRSFTDPTRNKTVFSNFKELQSQISDETLRRMQEMINANKVYMCSIVTDNGIVFKNNTGETTLTASVMDGGVDMTDALTMNWTKDGKAIGSGKSIKVTAADVVEKSVYRYEAVDSGGKFRGSYEVTVMDVMDGADGAQGPKGETGAAGADGKTSYFHIKYSSVAKPTSASQMTETPSAYIGTYVDYTQADSTDPTKYTWSRFEGIQGAKGDQGIPGTNGENGKTSYLHIAYANDDTGTSGFSVSDSSGKLYIGQYTDFVQADSTDPSKYSWTKIKGETGAIGPQGPQGPQGDPGDKGDPTGVLELPTEPPTKFDGMLWKCTGNLSGFIRDAVYRWDGKVWGLFTFSANNIKAETFFGYLFNGSKFVSPFSEKIGDDQYDGELRIADGEIVIDYKVAHSYGEAEYIEEFFDYRKGWGTRYKNANGAIIKESNWASDLLIINRTIKDLQGMNVPEKLVNAIGVTQGAVISVPVTTKNTLVVMCGVSGQFTQCIIPKSYRGTSRVTCYYSAGTAVTFEFSLVSDTTLNISRIYKEGAWASYNVQMEIWGI